MHTEPTRQLRDMIEDALEIGLSDRVANEMHNALSNLEVSLALPLTEPIPADSRPLRIYHAYREQTALGPIAVAACGHVRGTGLDATYEWGDEDFEEAACADCFSVLADRHQPWCA